VPHERAEVDLLLSCSRTQFTPQHRKRAEAIAAGHCDWEWIVRLARSSGTAPLLYHNLKGTGILPPLVERDLRSYFSANAMRGNALTEELARIARILDEAKIDFLPYKGSALALSVYGDVALRQFEDIDIFLREADVVRAGFALIACGYYPLRADWTRAQWPPKTRRALAHVAFSDPTGCVLIELQSRFVLPWMRCEFDYQGLWERTRELTIGGRRMRVLSPEDTLMVLSIHAAKHCWERLEWVCGIAELLRAFPEIDWDAVLRRTAADGTQRMLFLGLVLATELLGAALPPRVEKALRGDAAAGELARRAERWLLVPDVEAAGDERIVFTVRARERWADRFLCLFTVTAEYAFLALYHPRRRRGSREWFVALFAAVFRNGAFWSDLASALEPTRANAARSLKRRRL
jgi:hypothetical protein